MTKREAAVILEAIRKRDRGCPFCMAGEAVQGKTARMGISLSDNELLIEMTIPGTKEKIGTMFRIKFCPKCGKRLEEEDE